MATPALVSKGGQYLRIRLYGLFGLFPILWSNSGEHKCPLLHINPQVNKYKLAVMSGLLTPQNRPPPMVYKRLNITVEVQKKHNNRLSSKKNDLMEQRRVEKLIVRGPLRPPGVGDSIVWEL